MALVSPQAILREGLSTTTHLTVTYSRHLSINNDSYNHSTKRLQSYQFHAEKTLAVYEENCSQ